MASSLRTWLGPDFDGTIEHVGSTAIPGIPAKPVVDIVVEAADVAQVRAILCAKLNTHAWECWNQRGHFTFIKRERFGGKRTHHVHLRPAGLGREEKALFRDYLRDHPDEARAYADLKRELVRAHDERKRGAPAGPLDRERYSNAKLAFVEGILRKARGRGP